MGFFGSIVKHFVSFGLRLFSLVNTKTVMFGSNSLWFFQGLPSTSLRCWVTKTLTSSSSTGWSITWEAATRWEGDTRTTRSYDWCECGVMWVLFQYWTELLMVLLAVWLSAWLVPLCVQLMNMKECVPSCDATLPHVFQIESGTVWKQVYIDLGIPVLNSAASYNVKTAYKK